MAKKKAKAKKPAAAKRGGRKKDINKSEAIRDYADAHTGAGPTEISTELAKQGVVVTTGFVSTVMTNARKKTKNKGRRRQAPAKASKQPGDLVLVADLLKAKQLAERLGGVEQAQRALKALSKHQ